MAKEMGMGVASGTHCGREFLSSFEFSKDVHGPLGICILVGSKSFVLRGYLEERLCLNYDDDGIGVARQQKRNALRSPSTYRNRRRRTYEFSVMIV